MKFYKIFFWSFVIFLTTAFSGFSQPCHLCDHLTKDLKEGSTAFREFMEQDFGAVNGKGIDAYEALNNWEVLRRNPLDLNIVNSYLNRTSRTILQFKEELFTDLPSIRQWLNDQAINIFKFTSKQIDDFVSYSTKQDSQLKIMLGKYDNGGPNGYIAKAGDNHTYFDMGNKWDEAKNLVTGGSNNWADEMWEINKKFLQNQKNQGKEFWLSHDPFSPGNDQFFAREVNWLIDNGAQDFQQVGDLWKVIW